MDYLPAPKVGYKLPRSEGMYPIALLVQVRYLMLIRTYPRVGSLGLNP
jgi:hypothetical protein